MKKKIYIIIGVIVVVAMAVGVILFLNKGKEQESAIQIGIILPLTGSRGSFGHNSKNGIELAIEEINSSDSIDVLFQATYEDSQSNSQTAVSAFHKLLNDGIEIVVGPISSQEVLSIAPIAEKNHVVLFSPGASSPEISNAGDFIFRNVPSDIYEASLMAEFARDTLSLKNIAVLYNNSDYGVGVKDAFSRVFKEKGGTVFFEAYQDGSNDFRTQLTKLKKYDMDAIYFIGYTELGVMVKQAMELGFKCQFLTTAVFEDEGILRTASNAAENIIFTSITFDINNPSERAKHFVFSYKNNFNKEPDGYAAVAYDAIYILANAIQVSKEKNISTKDALYYVNNFPGLLGDLTFNSNGDILVPIKLKTVKNNKVVDY